MTTTYRILVDEDYLKEAERLAVGNTPVLKLFYQNPWIQWPPRVILPLALVYFAVVNEWTAAAFAAILVALSILNPIISRRRAAKSRQRNRLRDSILTFALDDEGIDTTNKFSNAHLQWPAVINAVIYPQGVLLQVTPRGFAWLPDNSLTGGSPPEVRQLVADHVKDSRPAKP